jgi:hypothetical protein
MSAMTFRDRRAILAIATPFVLAGCEPGSSSSSDATHDSTDETHTASTGGTTSEGSAATSSSMSTTTNSADETSSGTMGQTGDSNASADGREPIDHLSEDFEDGDLGEWNMFQADEATLSVADGELHYEPHADTLWFNRTTSSFLWKSIVGDFRVTAIARAESLSSPGSPPVPNFRLGGIMARNGDSGEENYVFIVIGADNNDLSIETKTTQNGQSEFDGPTWPVNEAELRICRVGAEFRMMARQMGGSWETRATYQRPDLPSSLQVGPMGYANNSPPDLRVSFDLIEFSRIVSPDDCDE